MPNITSFAEQLAQGGDAGAFEPQRQNNWLFQFPSTLSSGDQLLLLMSLDSGFLPKASNEEIEINVLNRKLYVAGPRRYEAGTLVLKDFVDKDTAGSLAVWHNSVYFPSSGGGTVFMPGDYKQNCSILLFAPNGSMQRVWTLAGCWPSSVDYGTLDMKSADFVSISVTIRYDEATYEGGF